MRTLRIDEREGKKFRGAVLNREGLPASSLEADKQAG